MVVEVQVAALAQVEAPARVDPVAALAVEVLVDALMTMSALVNVAAVAVVVPVVEVEAEATTARADVMAITEETVR